MSVAGIKDIKECQKLLAEELKRVEEQIFEAEGKYLEETNAYGILVARSSAKSLL